MKICFQFARHNIEMEMKTRNLFYDGRNVVPAPQQLLGKNSQTIHAKIINIFQLKFYDILIRHKKFET